MKFLNEIDGANKLVQDSSNRLVTDTEKSTWNGKQSALTFDNTPTAASTNPVTSGGIKTALDSKVPTTRTINSKALSENINLTASDVGASAVVNLTVNTAVGTEAKTTVESFTPSENTLYLVRFVNGNTVSTPTLNGINIRLGVTNASTTTMSISGNIIVPMIYDATNNKFQITGSYRTSDTSETYTVRWNAAVKVGTQVTQYKLLTQGIDGKYYPTTIGNTTASTKTINTVPFLIGSPIIFYSYTTTIAADGVTSASYNYTGVTTSTTTYAWNQNSGWRANEDVYLKGTVSGALFTLDNTTLTSHMTQDLPTTEDGFYYMRLGMFTTSTTGFKLSLQHPVFYYANNELQSLNTSNGISWEDILGRPETFMPSEHTHNELHTHSNSSILDATTASFTTALKTKLDGVSTGANKVLNSAINGNVTIDGTEQTVYTHPTTAGNKHIPTGGSANQVLKYSSDGTAVWGTDANTVTTINGKTGAIAKADIVALGIPAQDTVVDISGKVDKVAGKGLSTEDYTTAEKTKLAGVATGANNYTHPANHPPSIITQDENNRFVTDTEKAAWSGKAASSHTHNYAGSASAGGAATTATKLATARTIDGVSFNGTANIVTRLRFANTSVAASAFAADATYTEYPFRAAVALSGVTAEMTPDVVFSCADAAAGAFAPVAECYAGGVYIYALSAPNAAMTIPTITCWI